MRVVAGALLRMRVVHANVACYRGVVSPRCAAGDVSANMSSYKNKMTRAHQRYDPTPVAAAARAARAAARVRALARASAHNPPPAPADDSR